MALEDHIWPRPDLVRGLELESEKEYVIHVNVWEFRCTGKSLGERDPRRTFTSGYNPKNNQAVSTIVPTILQELLQLRFSAVLAYYLLPRANRYNF